MVFWVVGVLLVAVALVVWGVRGKVERVGPTCRRCTFDLSGLPTPLTRCPECGSDLERSRAVVDRLRKRRPIVITIGLLLLLAFGTLGSVAAWSRVPTPAVQATLPGFVLRIETMLTPTLRAAALTEIVARANAGTISQGEVDGLIARALEVQADPDQTWDPAWGDFLYTLRMRSGMVSDDAWIKFVRAGVDISLVARPRVRVGQRVPVAFVIKGGRLGSSGNIVGPIEITRRTTNSDGTFSEGTWSSSVSPLGTSMTAFQLPNVFDAPGRRSLDVSAAIALKSNSAGSSTTLATWTLPLHADVEIVSADSVAANVIRSPELKRRMTKALEKSRVSLVSSDGNQLLEVALASDSSPAPLSARVFARPAGDRSANAIEIGTISKQPDSNWTYIVANPWPNGVPVPIRVDVILKPDAHIAESSLNLNEFLDEEIVLENVPVNQPPSQK
ncbi:MAG: hypothetical protein SFY96_13575 [Planctomycetota bacterium]|nr:hypothetical protein [Planctomycetota bacterium]